MKKFILFGTLTICCLSAAISAGCSKGQTGGNNGSTDEDKKIIQDNYTNGTKKGKFGDKLPHDFKFIAPDLRTNDKFNNFGGLKNMPEITETDPEQPLPEQPVPEPAPFPTPKKPRKKCHPHLFRDRCPDGKCPDGKCPDGKCPDGKCPDGKCPDNN